MSTPTDKSSAKVPIKPKDWPANDRERFLDVVVRLLKDFVSHPSYKTKDAIVAISCNYDYHQKLMLGMCRVTDYEVMLVNSIYKAAHHYFLFFLQARLYEIVADVAWAENCAWKCSAMLPGRAPMIFRPIEAYTKLEKPLRLFYFAYQEYVCCKGGNLASYLIKGVRYLYECKLSRERMVEIAMAFSMMLMDLSIMRGSPNEREIHFTRKELSALFLEEANLITRSGCAPENSPFRGVLMVQISSFLLRSRTGYHDGVSYKCIHTEDARKSWQNGQLWMKRIKLLNDDREGACLRELISELPKLGCAWLRSFSFKPTRRYWVSSFTKVCPEEGFKKKYGHAVYGYKGDRAAEFIAPLMKRHWVRSDGCASYDDYALSQVVCLDVLYDKRKAKSELKFLCSIIDNFKMSAAKKRAFLKDILQYWMLSVKDPKWKNEKERRYILFDHFGDEYLDVEVGKKFFKVRTDLLKSPDFIIPPHPLKAEFNRYIGNIMGETVFAPCLYCENCLNRDYDTGMFGSENPRCSICGSGRLRYIE